MAEGDAFELDEKKYVVLVDYYSRYPEIAYVPDLTSRMVIAKLKNIFARWGIPEILVSDNGPPFFSEEFKSFNVQFGFAHVSENSASRTVFSRGGSSSVFLGGCRVSRVAKTRGP